MGLTTAEREKLVRPKASAMDAISWYASLWGRTDGTSCGCNPSRVSWSSCWRPRRLGVGGLGVLALTSLMAVVAGMDSPSVATTAHQIQAPWRSQRPPHP
jgi:hypothetical protein